MKIFANYFQPFDDKRTVISLSFPFDPPTKKKLQTGIALIKASTQEENICGWLPDKGKWFVEPRIWRPLFYWLHLVGVQVQWCGDRDWQTATGNVAETPVADALEEFVETFLEGLKRYKNQRYRGY